ncbi:hypothetical protein GJ633_11355 [Halorubrum sp. CBA1125]|uniref:hypothetical protein n=1 Tax=Halorubrum sp. CBA1125 TaxID=2668072 RepID=UPI0012E9641E|nr:hypothetical protein [Halorubrum sp. CBA1125]MUW15180.1 hypothetical protein [Halorubrum sp. CBA1125]
MPERKWSPTSERSLEAVSSDGRRGLSAGPIGGSGQQGRSTDVVNTEVAEALDVTRPTDAIRRIRSLVRIRVFGAVDPSL